jgi:hypothetical protein
MSRGACFVRSSFLSRVFARPWLARLLGEDQVLVSPFLVFLSFVLESSSCSFVMNHVFAWDWGKKPPRLPARPLTPEEQKNVKRIAAGVIIYWIISEASRLFPPRNLIPEP